MFKKIIALTLIFAMLVPFTAAAAADEPSESRSMEEILDEYHRRAFEAQAQGNTRSASANARSGGKTLEEETVDALTEAGYEAYNVTAGNYDTLEAQLQTDFAAMGLDPEGSYIIVIHGEPEGGETNGNSRMIDPPTEDDFGDGTGGSGIFDYTYNGVSYLMRFVTVIPTTTNGQFVHSYKTIESSYWFQSGVSKVSDAVLVAAIDNIPLDPTGTTFPTATVIGLIIDLAEDESYIEIDPTSVIVEAESNWTCQVIQVWCAQHGAWEAMQYSESVHSQAQYSYYKDIPGEPEPVKYVSDEYHCTFYSWKYDNYAQRYEDAVAHYLATAPGHTQDARADCVYSVRFCLAGDDIEITDGYEGAFLFAHTRNFDLENNIE